MLESIRIRNYKSIYDTTLNLEYGKKRAPKNYSSLPFLTFLEEKGKRVVPLVVIYGANSSGKSTFLDAFRTLVSIVRNGIGEGAYSPSKFLLEKETLFSLSALIDGRRYSYSISYDESSIRNESLSLDSELLFDEENISSSMLKEKIGDALVSPFSDYLMSRILFFNPFSYSVSSSFETYVKLSGKKREECMDDIIELSGKLDLGIEDIKGEEQWEIEHLSKERKGVWLKMEEESEGTKRLFALSSMILSSLSSGSLLVVDEIDVSLHSIVLRNIVSLFLDKSLNTNNAQLICSSHNTDLIDAPFISAGEIAVFEKTRKNGSVIERLTEAEGKMSMKKLREEYLKGRFSGIPFPYL